MFTWELSHFLQTHPRNWISNCQSIQTTTTLINRMTTSWWWWWWWCQWCIFWWWIINNFFQFLLNLDFAFFNFLRCQMAIYHPLKSWCNVKGHTFYKDRNEDYGWSREWMKERRKRINISCIPTLLTPSPLSKYGWKRKGERRNLEKKNGFYWIFCRSAIPEFFFQCLH